MGGMIAQTLAARYPQRVMSLASIFSTTGSLRVSQPAFKTIRSPASSRNQRESVRDYLWSHAFRRYDAGMGRAGHRDATPCKPGARRRGSGNLGMARQIGAIINSGDRTQELQRIRAATRWSSMLRKDLMVATSGELRPRRRPFPRARLVLPGMGHDFPACLTGTLLSLLAGQMH